VYMYAAWHGWAVPMFLFLAHRPTLFKLLHRQVTLSSGRGSVGPAAPLGASRDEDGGRYSSTKRGAFHEVFNLQESERPLTVCESGWRCCLINRDRKSPTDYIRNGYLYVTENHLCFESSSSRSGSSKRNKVIKLADITDIQKYKVLSVLPGSGSGISIATPSTTRLVMPRSLLLSTTTPGRISTRSKVTWKSPVRETLLRLTENMRRLKRGLKPLSNFKRNLTALSSWYSIYTSAIAFIPELTQKLYVGLWLAFISSCLLPFKLLGFFIGVYAGIKFFVIDFLFKSCPKLRQRFDTPFIIWTHLPTDLQLKERGGSTLTRRLSESEQLLVVFVTVSLSDPLKCSCSSVGPAAPLVRAGMKTEGDTAAPREELSTRVFNLQESERPLTVCESETGSRPLTTIRNGYLYVTENHLCFESSSSRSGSSKRNKVIKLADITDIQKYKVLSVLPGSGSGNLHRNAVHNKGTRREGAMI
ncbi:hypothetical protein KUCAC02_022053, partial [Chaenocephalus aceratus]